LPHEIGNLWLWAGFIVAVLFILALDLGVFHRKAHSVGHREALIWTTLWVALALMFNAWIWRRFGAQHGLEFLTGYVIEYSLSIDNIFVFLLVFRYFAVPPTSQHRVLFWGILGAMVMRAIFILVGSVLIAQFNWIIYIFGAFLVFTGYKMLTGSDVEVHPETNPIVKLFRRLVPITSHYEGSRMTVMQHGKRMATPLLLVLVVIEATDLVFAVDSIPAIFAVTDDPFIVFTSNICAILGLRSLYFLLEGAMNKFHYLKVGLGIVLSFVGVKMLVSGFWHITILGSLGFIVLVLASSMVASLLRKPPVAEPLPVNPGGSEDPIHRKEHHLK
jgi:tellurite resistance protein TerC